jgi:hypothetical protein
MERPRDRLLPILALALGVLTTLMLVVSAPRIGLTWDEPAYIAASEASVLWFDRLVHAPRYALSPQAIQTYWDINHEHPPLNKIWGGLVWSGARQFLDELSAHRLGNMLLVGALVATLFYTVGRSFGTGAGLVAAAALITLPRFFFHAHLAALDVPAAAAVFGVTALFWHTRGRPSFGWDVVLGLAWGAALATKINALLVIPALLLWLVLFERRGRLFGRVLAMALLGALVFVALWPWLYHDTLVRLGAYWAFITVAHWEIGQWYLHEWHMPPPWHFAPVMLVAVVPAQLLVFALLGLARGVYGLLRQRRGTRDDGRRTTDEGRQTTDEGRRTTDDGRQTRDDHRSDSWSVVRGPWSVVLLWALSAAAPLGALMIGQTKVYDNERLFMPAFPFLAALAGVGLAWVVGAGLRLWRERTLSPLVRGPVLALSLLFVPAAFVPHLAASAALYPHLLSYYSETVGGLPGAVRIGLETTYWCETYDQAVPVINAQAPEGALVWAEPWSHDVLLYYQLTGRLRKDLRVAMQPGAGTILAARGAEGVEATIDDADYVIIAQRETGLAVHPEMRVWAEGRTPILRIERFGVPLMELYEGR